MLSNKKRKQQNQNPLKKPTRHIVEKILSNANCLAFIFGLKDFFHHKPLLK